MIKPFFAAWRFLTVIPLPASLGLTERDLGRSAPFFPLVGLFVGLAAAGLDYGLCRILPVSAASALVVVFLLSVSGALHMDGLADTADGFFSSRSRERMLEIMRDSRIGPMGVIALVCVLILKVSLLASIAEPYRMPVIFLTPLAGRSVLLLQMSLLTYARPAGGLASVFQNHFSRRKLIIAAVFPAVLGWLAGGWPGLFGYLACLSFGLLFAAYAKSKIGGYTGDTLGAACELAELVLLLACVIFLQQVV